ncbi:carboxylic ester hydrolase [Caerostris extrusa]|uniref:Carboxylic ester hydrolase n=1 Tax=Caerostris extrusa TaxID=172846 RepID=A0AAV4MCS4_CAEEX|nr:carboxylic ester hydrolase [Caerostris extrusa]
MNKEEGPFFVTVAAPQYFWYVWSGWSNNRFQKICSPIDSHHVWLPCNFTPEEEQLSRRMMSRWLAFAKTGNPNIPGTLKWPVFKHDDPEYLEIKDEEMVRLRPDNFGANSGDRYQADIDEKVYKKVRRNSVSSGGHQPDSNHFLRITSFLLAFLWTIIIVV